MAKWPRGVRQRQWGSWVSEIRNPVTKRRVWLGTFKSVEAATQVYHSAARFLYSRMHPPNTDTTNTTTNNKGCTPTSPRNTTQYYSNFELPLPLKDKLVRSCCPPSNKPPPSTSSSSRKTIFRAKDQTLNRHSITPSPTNSHSHLDLIPCTHDQGSSSSNHVRDDEVGDDDYVVESMINELLCYNLHPISSSWSLLHSHGPQSY